MRSKNGEVLCPKLICEHPAAFSTTGMTEFLKRKQDRNIPELAKLKKVARLYDSLEQKWVLCDELRPYISQGLALHFNDSNNEVYGNSAARYVNSWEV